MAKVKISVLYNSSYGHTRQVASILAGNMESEQSIVHLLSTEEAEQSLSLLHESDTIVFGSPTYFGNVSSGFKRFMEITGSFWYKQLWKDKLAAGFTTSSTTSGDKLNTLNAIFLFAAQHSMHWINLGVLPRFLNDQQTDGQNRLASYIGLMTQSDNSTTQVSRVHDSDQLTAELFAERILKTTLQLKSK